MITLDLLLLSQTRLQTLALQAGTVDRCPAPNIGDNSDSNFNKIHSCFKPYPFVESRRALKPVVYLYVCAQSGANAEIPIYRHLPLPLPPHPK